MCRPSAKHGKFPPHARKTSGTQGSMDVTNSVIEFDDFFCVLIDGAVRKPFLLYRRYGSLSGYIVLATGDVKLING